MPAPAQWTSTAPFRPIGKRSGPCFRSLSRRKCLKTVRRFVRRTNLGASRRGFPIAAARLVATHAGGPAGHRRWNRRVDPLRDGARRRHQQHADHGRTAGPESDRWGRFLRTNPVQWLRCRRLCRTGVPAARGARRRRTRARKPVGSCSIFGCARGLWRHSAGRGTVSSVRRSRRGRVRGIFARETSRR